MESVDAGWRVYDDALKSQREKQMHAGNIDFYFMCIAVLLICMSV